MLAHRRAARDQQRAYVIDGPTLVGDALATGTPIEAVFVDAEASVAAGAVVGTAAAAGVDVWQLEPGVLARATETVTSQGMAAIARQPDASLDDALAADVVLVLVGVADPGNAGTLLRSAEAAGVGAVVFCARSVDPFAPKVVRASAGALFRTTVISRGDPVEVLDRLGTRGRRRLGTSVRLGIEYERADMTGPLAVVLGNEAHGLPDELSSGVDEWVRIPMAGRIESLNVAMAGTVLCFELARQRRAQEST